MLSLLDCNNVLFHACYFSQLSDYFLARVFFSLSLFFLLFFFFSPAFYRGKTPYGHFRTCCTGIRCMQQSLAGNTRALFALHTANRTNKNPMRACGDFVRKHCFAGKNVTQKRTKKKKKKQHEYRDWRSISTIDAIHPYRYTHIIKVIRRHLTTCESKF